MVKSPKIAKIPEVLVSFLESINLIPPKQKLLNICFFFVLCYLFPKKDKQTLTSVLSFFVFSKKETQKTKNEIRLPFYRFSFYVQTNTKTEKAKNDFRFIVFPFKYKQTQKTKKQKMTSVLSFFFLCARKHKNGKTKFASVLSFFLLSTNKHIIRKNGNRLPFYRFLVFQRTDTKNGKT